MAVLQALVVEAVYIQALEEVYKLVEEAVAVEAVCKLAQVVG